MVTLPRFEAGNALMEKSGEAALSTGLTVAIGYRNALETLPRATTGAGGAFLLSSDGEGDALAVTLEDEQRGWTTGAGSACSDCISNPKRQDEFPKFD
jgi:hypothetical protein